MKSFQLATLAVGASLGVGVANVHEQKCEARCGTQVGFLSAAHPPLYISYEADGTLQVPQQCREARCGAIETEVAELKAALAATIASNADLAARLHAIETRTVSPTSAPTVAAASHKTLDVLGSVLTPSSRRAVAPQRSWFEMGPALSDDSIPYDALGDREAWGSPEHPQGIRGAVGACAVARRPAEGRALSAGAHGPNLCTCSRLTLTP